VSQARAKTADFVIWWRLIFWVAVGSAVVLACIPELPMATERISDKLLHFGAFVVLTTIASFAYPKIRPLAMLLCLSALGLGIEFLQSLPIVKRSPEGLDFLADLAGISLTLVCVVTIRSLARMTRRVRPG
jgi:hypothetical protein